MSPEDITLEGERLFPPKDGWEIQSVMIERIKYQADSKYAHVYACIALQKTVDGIRSKQAIACEVSESNVPEEYDSIYAQFLTLFPPSQGWIKHRVRLQTMPIDRSLADPRPPAD